MIDQTCQQLSIVIEEISRILDPDFGLREFCLDCLFITVYYRVAILAFQYILAIPQTAEDIAKIKVAIYYDSITIF